MQGGCYCGAVRYEISGDPIVKAQCHCRECQYISGGGPNYFLLVASADHTFTQGAPKTFTRSDLENPVTRGFCSDCGTHLLTRLPGRDQIVVKVGTLDDPGGFSPQMAVFTTDMQPFHLIPDGTPAFERLPNR